jgi:glycosyltransferase involved in cell wall biosynthesis
MRVLFIGNTFPPGYTGGAEIATYNTCQGLLAHGVECSILIANNRMPQPINDWYNLDGLPVHRVHFPTRKRRPSVDVFDPRIYRLVLKELRTLKPDLVHMNNVSGTTLAPYVACRALNIPVVNTLHDHWLLCPNNMLYRRDASFCDPAQGPGRCRECFTRYDFWGDVPYRRRVFAALTSNVKAFICPSQALIRVHVRAGYDARRFRHIPYGINDKTYLEHMHPEAAALAGEHIHLRVLTFAGAGVEIKGAGVLLRAIPILARYIEGLRVNITGIGGEEAYLAGFRNLAPTVKVIGWVAPDEMRSLFAASDLVVVPSTCHESYSIVTLQGMQVGTPVVGSNFGGIRELVLDGETGYLFPVGDAAALAEKVILHFSKPPVERRRMRQRCIQHARQLTTPERHIEQVLGVYREVLQA